MKEENKSLQFVYFWVLLANALYIAMFYLIMKTFC
jgi:hypothetical protein